MSHNTDLLTEFDPYLADHGPAALVIREPLVPVEGADAVFFPATYAASEDKTFQGGYNIDQFPDGTNVALVDSVGSQANRIEPLFKAPPYAALVPQIVIRVGDKEVNLLDAGHRAADALVRYSALKDELQAAFVALHQGDATPLARIAPTSLVFGVWDSRETQARAPRLLASTIRAFDVKRLTRSAQYWAGGSPDAVTVYDQKSVLGPIPDGKEKKPETEARSNCGFTHVPASSTHGGVIAGGNGIRRDATLALAALRLLRSPNADETTKLRRYILGLALVAFTKLPGGYLRQGTILVPAGHRICQAVAADGTRTDVTLTHEAALAYAQAAAAAFGVPAEKEKREKAPVPFAVEPARAAVKAARKKKAPTT